jgi:hypothetical protein
VNNFFRILLKTQKKPAGCIVNFYNGVKSSLEGIANFYNRVKLRLDGIVNFYNTVKSLLEGIANFYNRVKHWLDGIVNFYNRIKHWLEGIVNFYNRIKFMLDGIVNFYNQKNGLFCHFLMIYDQLLLKNAFFGVCLYYIEAVGEKPHPDPPRWGGRCGQYVFSEKIKDFDFVYSKLRTNDYRL